MKHVAAALVALLPAPALAQALQCDLPGSVPRPRPDLPSADQPKRDIPIGSYTLALSWAPEYCRTRKTSANDRFQCGGGNRFGFTLHGLWPDGRGKEWPQYCRPASLLPEPILRRTLCATPSPQLLQHEWAKHGTCMTRSPDEYFAQATRLYATIRYPDMDALARSRSLTVAGFKRAFVADNPRWKPAMVRVTLNRRGWLDELWLCLGTDFKPERCAAGSGGASANARVRIQRAGAVSLR